MIGRWIGRGVYYKNKGEIWLNPLQRWVLPALGGSAALKYLGVSATSAILVMTGVALLWEVAAVLIGWFEHRSGATESHYDKAASTDPFRRGSLEKLERVAAASEQIRAELGEIRFLLVQIEGRDTTGSANEKADGDS